MGLCVFMSSSGNGAAGSLLTDHLAFPSGSTGFSSAMGLDPTGRKLVGRPAGRSSHMPRHPFRQDRPDSWVNLAELPAAVPCSGACGRPGLWWLAECSHTSWDSAGEPACPLPQQPAGNVCSVLCFPSLGLHDSLSYGLEGRRLA